jgi:hypothetical protein
MYDAWAKDGIQGIARVRKIREQEWEESHPSAETLIRQARVAAERVEMAERTRGTEMTPPPGK